MKYFKILFVIITHIIAISLFIFAGIPNATPNGNQPTNSFHGTPLNIFLYCALPLLIGALLLLALSIYLTKKKVNLLFNCILGSIKTIFMIPFTIFMWFIIGGVREIFLTVNIISCLILAIFTAYLFVLKFKLVKKNVENLETK